MVFNRLVSSFSRRIRLLLKQRSPLQGLVVLFDLDGVLCASQESIIDCANERLGTKFRVDCWGGPGPNIFEKITFLCGQPPKDVAKWLFHEDIMCSAVPIPGAQSFVRRLYMQGAELAIATARPAFQRKATVRWVSHYFPYFEEDAVHLRPKGSDGKLLDIAEFKAQQIRSFCPVVYIEDSGNIAVELATEYNFPFSTHICLVDRPWNWILHIPRRCEKPRRFGRWHKDPEESDYGWEALFEYLLEAAEKLHSSD